MRWRFWLIVFSAFMGLCPLRVWADSTVVGDSTTVTVEEVQVEMDCMNLEIQSGGTFELISGELNSVGHLVIHDGGVFLNSGGIVRYCFGMPVAIYLLLLD